MPRPEPGITLSTYAVNRNGIPRPTRMTQHEHRDRTMALTLIMRCRAIIEFGVKSSSTSMIVYLRALSTGSQRRTTLDRRVRAERLWFDARRSKVLSLRCGTCIVGPGRI